MSARSRLLATMDRWVHRSARRQFERHRPLLIQRLAEVSARRDQPEGLQLRELAAAGPTRFAVDPAGMLTAAQPVEITFDAVADGGMEDAPGLATVKSAVALFHLLDGHWAVGRCLYNVDADEVVRTIEAGDTTDG